LDLDIQTISDLKLALSELDDTMLIKLPVEIYSKTGTKFLLQ
jgi:hypothetical protein